MSTVETTGTAAVPAPLPVLNSIGQAFTILYRNLPSALLVFAPAVAVWLPTALVPAWRMPGDTLDNQVIFGALFALGILTSLMATMALVQATLRYLQDGTFPAVAAYRQSFARVLPFLVVAVTAFAIDSLSIALLVVPFLIVMPMFFLAPTIWLTERCSLVDAFSRSAAMTRGNRRRILGIFAAVVAMLAVLHLAADTATKVAAQALQAAGTATFAEVSWMFGSMLLTVLAAVTYHRLTAGGAGGQSGLKSSATPLMQ